MENKSDVFQFVMEHTKPMQKKIYSRKCFQLYCEISINSSFGRSCIIFDG